MSDQSTTMAEAREKRIARRLAIIKALQDPTKFRLVLHALNAERVYINLDFAANEFPGRYISQLIDYITDLEELGILIRYHDVTQSYAKGDVWQEPQDTVAVEFIEMLYR
jgi:hypothetical protein